VKPDQYVAQFPPTEKTYPSRIVIQRDTGQIYVESGEAPLGELNAFNVHRSGVCRRADSRL
jgi:hypothetical protein